MDPQELNRQAKRRGNFMIFVNKAVYIPNWNLNLKLSELN